MRKSDGDLKDAIDLAWDALASIGQARPGFRSLACPVRVFAAAAFDKRHGPVTGLTSRNKRQSRAVAVAVLLSCVGILSLESAKRSTAEQSVDAPQAGEKNVVHDPLAIAEGQAMFRGLCSGCHGGAGRGGKGPDLTDNRWIHGSTDADIARVIEIRCAEYNHEEAGDALKPEQIRKVISYIRSLARTPGESTWKPYMPGDAEAGPKDLLQPAE